MAHGDPRLAGLSRELERLAGRLSALVREGAERRLLLTPELMRLVLAMRLMGSDHIAPGLGEPAGNMLLALYAARLEGKILTPNRLSAASAVPGTTALRWLQVLGVRGLVLRSADPSDRRKVRLALSPEAVAGIEGYLAAIFERPILIP